MRRIWTGLQFKFGSLSDLICALYICLYRDTHPTPGPVASCIVCDTCSICSVNTYSAVRHFYRVKYACVDAPPLCRRVCVALHVAKCFHPCWCISAFIPPRMAIAVRDILPLGTPLVLQFSHNAMIDDRALSTLHTDIKIGRSACSRRPRTTILYRKAERAKLPKLREWSVPKDGSGRACHKVVCGSHS